MSFHPFNRFLINSRAVRRRPVLSPVLIQRNYWKCFRETDRKACGTTVIFCILKWNPSKRLCLCPQETTIPQFSSEFHEFLRSFLGLLVMKLIFYKIRTVFLMSSLSSSRSYIDDSTDTWQFLHYQRSINRTSFTCFSLLFL